MGIGNISNSGIKAAMTNMESISNNIANVNTLGFKKTQVNFSDIYSGNGGGGQQIGLGTRVHSIRQDFSRGRTEFTQSSYDLSLQKDGFFIQKDAVSGLVSYTRAGRLNFDAEGYLTGFNGHIQGFPATDGVIAASGNLVDMQVPISTIPAQPTGDLAFQINLDSNASVLGLPFDKNDPGTYNYRTDETIYDSLGNTYVASLYYVKTADNAWNTQVVVDDALVGSGTATYNTDGSLATQGGMTGLSFNPGNGASTPQTFDISLTGSTQYAGSNKVYDHRHNGMASGKLAGVSIDKDGKIIASYTNLLTRVEGQIAVAQFRSNEGLLQSNNMSWLPSADSGPAIVGPDTSQNAFTLNSVEYSNVDLTEELVKLIGAQHDFQANAQVQQVYNQILKTIENL